MKYNKEYLATHTLAGGNQNKQAMYADVVKAVIGKFFFVICLYDSLHYLPMCLALAKSTFTFSVC